MSKKSDTVKMITETILLYKGKVHQTPEVILKIQKLQQQLDIIDNLKKPNEKRSE